MRTSILHAIKTIQKYPIFGKTVLLRVDFNISLTKKRTLADDQRIVQSLPTIKHLLKNHNKIILISHLGRPLQRDPKYSLSPVAKKLQSFLLNYKVILVDDFLSSEGKKQLEKQQTREVILLENIRFYPGEQNTDKTFAKKLAAIGDVYVNDAFGVSHRNDSSIVLLPKLLPSFAGLLLEKELQAISSVANGVKKPFTAIIGGAKISTKIAFLSKLITLADYVLLAGAIANTFLLAAGKQIGRSLIEKDQIQQAQKLLQFTKHQNATLVLPSDVIGSLNENKSKAKLYNIDSIPEMFSIYDIGPKTQAQFAHIINASKTIIWNGPVGYYEEESYCRGTDFLYYTITHAQHAYTLVGGGDTLAAISNKEYLQNITHISTGGGAMLELIENNTLPGLEALKS